MKGEQIANTISLLVNKKKDGSEAYSDMDAFVNSYSVDAKGFIEALKKMPEKVQNEWTRMCFNYVRMLNKYYRMCWYDDRNKVACEIASRIYNIVGERGYIRNEDETKFIEMMSNDHRTLQQTFAEVCYYWINERAKDSDTMYKKELCEITKVLGDGFYRLPLI